MRLSTWAKKKKLYRTDFGILIPGYRIDAVDYESAKIFDQNRIFWGHPANLSGDDGKFDFFEKSQLSNQKSFFNAVFFTYNAFRHGENDSVMFL